jgi:hypothetical protein
MYQADYPHINWHGQAVWMRAIHGPLRLAAAGLPGPPLYDLAPENLDMSMVYYKAALGSMGSYLVDS